MGTDKSYQAYQKKKAAHRAAGKGSITPYVPVCSILNFPFDHPDRPLGIGSQRDVGQERVDLDAPSSICISHHPLIA